MFEALAQGLAAWGPGMFLKTSVWLYPLVNAAHILSIGALLTSVLLMDGWVLGLWGRRPGQQAVIAALRPVAFSALPAAMVTGFLLFSVQPLHYLANPAFQIKMLVLVLAIANALLFLGFRVPAAGRKILAGLSAVLWLGVLVSGRFIGFLD